MSRWKLLETWYVDLPGLTRDQLLERLTLAKQREAESTRGGMGRNPKARRDWRLRREAVEAELADRD